MSEIFPEKQPDASVPLTIAGMELSASLPDGVIPVSALVVVRCLAPDTKTGEGPDMLWWSATGGLPTWEICGMCDFVKHGVVTDWMAYSIGNEDEEEEG